MTEISGTPIDIENLSDFERHKVLRILQPGYWLLLSTDSLVRAAGLTGSDRFKGAVWAAQGKNRTNVGVPRRTNHPNSTIGRS